MLKVVFTFQNRPKGGITKEKERFAQDCEPIDDLEQVVRKVKPTAIIGVYVEKRHILLLSFFSINPLTAGAAFFRVFISY